MPPPDGPPWIAVGRRPVFTSGPSRRRRMNRAGPEVGAPGREEVGYIAIQSTRPQILAAALVDTPVGQLVWILDKFRDWTYPRATLPDAILDRDRLLTNAMIYWLTGTAGSSAYVGYAQDSGRGAPKQSGVPTGAIMFAHDVGIRRYAENENDITRWVDVQGRGGHFAAMEEPALLVDDVREFFRDLR